MVLGKSVGLLVVGPLVGVVLGLAVFAEVGCEEMSASLVTAPEFLLKAEGELLGPGEGPELGSSLGATLGRELAVDVGCCEGLSLWSALGL